MFIHYMNTITYKLEVCYCLSNTEWYKNCILYDDHRKDLYGLCLLSNPSLFFIIIQFFLNKKRIKVEYWSNVEFLEKIINKRYFPLLVEHLESIFNLIVFFKIEFWSNSDKRKNKSISIY